MFSERIDSMKLMLNNAASNGGHVRRTAMQRAEKEFYQACKLAETPEEWAILKECMDTLNEYKEKGYNYV